MTARARRIEYCRYGRRGDQVKAVRTVQRGVAVVLVYFRTASGESRTRTFPCDRRGIAEARAFCAAFHAQRTRQGAARPSATNRELWDAYTASPAWLALRDATRVNYTGRWRRWARYRGEDTPAEDTTVRHIDGYVTAALAAGIAANQVRQVLNVARVVHNWGVTRDVIASSALSSYRWKRPAGAVVNDPAEYSPEEFRRLIAACSPQDGRTWRIHVVLVLAGIHGQRANAVRHLRWQDLDADGIHWPAEWQKTGERTRAPLDQPWTWDGVAAIQTARWWTQRGAVPKQNHRQRIVAEALTRSPWVLPAHGRPEEPYGYQGLYVALLAAERRAGVDHRPYRGIHGGRKHAAMNVADRTGDAKLGMEWIGDVDLKQAPAYLKRRAERLERAAEAAESEGGNSR